MISLSGSSLFKDLRRPPRAFGHFSFSWPPPARKNSPLPFPLCRLRQYFTDQNDKNRPPLPATATFISWLEQIVNKISLRLSTKFRFSIKQTSTVCSMRREAQSCFSRGVARFGMRRVVGFGVLFLRALSDNCYATTRRAAAAWRKERSLRRNDRYQTCAYWRSTLSSRGSKTDRSRILVGVAGAVLDADPARHQPQHRRRLPERGLPVLNTWILNRDFHLFLGKTCESLQLCF